MELNERQIRILKAIIKNYLETGEPVGSRTISKVPDLNVSPATIRNEMADLEELGYIVQPHTSAGRIPTDKGYRFYVDELMEEKDREILDMKELMESRLDRVESVLKKMARMLANNTNYTTMISGPTLKSNELKLIQLSRLDATHLVAVVVVEGNVLKNKVIDINVPYTDEDLLKLNVLLNSALQGKSLDDLTLTFIRQLKNQGGELGPVISACLDAVVETIESSQADAPEVYTSGATNIFKYPELSEGSTAQEILKNIEEKETFFGNLNSEDTPSKEKDKNGIQVYIGGENPMHGMQDCSVVTASYELSKGVRGTIGIIGPKRMDYEHVVGTLKTLMEQLDDIYHKGEVK